MIVKSRRKDVVDVSDLRFVKADRAYDAVHNYLRLAWSDDGKHFQIAVPPVLMGGQEYETRGLVDPRVLWLDGRWTILLTANDPRDAAMSRGTTTNCEAFEHHGVMFAGANTQEQHECVDYDNGVVFPHALIRCSNDLFCLYDSGADRCTCSCEFSASDVSTSPKELRL